MNIDVDRSWPTVTADELRAVLDTFDYYRQGWANAIVYHERHSDRRIAWEQGGQHFLHPGLTIPSIGA